MSSMPRPIPTSLFGLPPLGALMKSAFGAPPKKAQPKTEPTWAKSGGTWPTPLSAAEASLDMNRMLAAAKVAPQLATIEWDGDRARSAAVVPETSRATVASDEETIEDDARDCAALDPRCRKIRERYVAARFPGVTRTLADLQSSDRVIKAARLYFEDEQPELAIELLEIAVQEATHESPIWLARLEILFLMRDGERFVDAARAFRHAHAGHDAWPEVERLGRALVPGETIFGATSGPREHEHYGPWPHTPNWIQAPWDLTAEVAAADFRRGAMRQAGRVAHS